MDATTSLFATHTGSTLLVVGAIQWLKNASWFPLIQKGAKVANRLASIVAAFLVQVGIHYTWNPQDHSLLLTGLSLSAITLALFHIASQYIYQETGYQMLSGIQAVQGILDFLKSAPAQQVTAKPMAPQAGKIL